MIVRVHERVLTFCGWRGKKTPRRPPQSCCHGSTAPPKLPQMYKYNLLYSAPQISYYVL